MLALDWSSLYLTVEKYRVLYTVRFDMYELLPRGHQEFNLS